MSLTNYEIRYLRERYGAEPKRSPLEDRISDPLLLAELLEEDGPDDMVLVCVDPFVLKIRDVAGRDWKWTVEVYVDGYYIQEIEHYTLADALDLADKHMNKDRKDMDPDEPKRNP
jgi:hypothetical protein